MTTVKRISVVEFHASEAIRSDIDKDLAQKHVSAIYFVSRSLAGGSRHDFEQYCIDCMGAELKSFGYLLDLQFED